MTQAEIYYLEHEVTGCEKTRKKVLYSGCFRNVVHRPVHISGPGVGLFIPRTRGFTSRSMAMVPGMAAAVRTVAVRAVKVATVILR